MLDTHIFIWWDSEPAKLTSVILSNLQNSANELVLSVASIWEIQIKAQLGKLTLRMPLHEIVESQQRRNGMQILSVEPSHVYALNGLPLHHKDPFDRLLIAQANTGGLVLVSVDPVFQSYPVTLL